MKAVVVANDTRGGVQPYLALALALRDAGHAVSMVVPGDFAGWVEGAGVRAKGLSGSLTQALQQSGGAAEKGALATARYAREQTLVHLTRWTREALEACEGAEVITGGVGGMLTALSVAEKLKVPFVETHLQPVGPPAASLRPLLFPNFPLRWLGHRLSTMALWMPFAGAAAAARREVLGLDGEAKPSQRLPVIYGISPKVVPPPREWSRARFTGYWTLNDDTALSPELDGFIRGGDAPVCIGFGSMASKKAGETLALIRGAVRLSGVRAVVLTGHSGMRAESEVGLFAASEAPHRALFPRMAAVVHHGGAGTTGAGLIAGVPSVVVPHTMDQPFWGSRVHELGCGPAPIPRKKLTAELLASALTAAVKDDTMRRAAGALGEQLRGEDGTGRAVGELERAHSEVAR